MPPPIDYTAYETGSRRSTVFSTKGVVCSSQVLASEAGLAILRQGGNAADAAVATAAALNVVEPCNTGIGGDAFALFWDAKQKRVRAVNGSGRSPAALNLGVVRGAGITGDLIPYTSAHAATVPGAAAALVDIHATFGSGKLTLAEVLAPAIQLAEDGFGVHQMASYEWGLFGDWLRQVAEKYGPGYPFLIDGKTPKPGQYFSNPDLGKTLRELGAKGKDAFYKGPIAEAIVEAVNSNGGVMTLEDLANHDTDFVEPISYTYSTEKLRVYECPPNGQGLAALIALGILDVLREDGVIDLETVKEGSAEWYHAEIEAIRLALADAGAYVADPNFVEVPVEKLLSNEYLRERAKLFNPKAATAKYHQGKPLSTSDTVYLTAADSEGNAISFIMSNYLGFGTAIVPKGCGFTLQSRGSAFSLDPNSPNVIEGGKRPFHTIIPAMVTKDNDLFMSYGVMGGPMQPQGHVQVLTTLLHRGRDPQLSLDAKRFCVGGTGLWGQNAKEALHNRSVAIEHGVDPVVIQQLRDLGHELELVKGPEQQFFGKGQVILRTVDERTGKRVWAAGSDFRGDGCALPQIS
ncbi:hypothetical protein Q8F55_007358 [Vanrija albida]|uniref:Gamma-glutamyltransferase n=1 Tax=Vanrija albida TaxID=181172 RepID=A0ABR3PTL2_9TREE